MSNNCQNTCGRGCHDTCNITDGTCQCRPGWQPPLCHRCSDDHYNVSNDCQNTCGRGCHDTCSRTDGTCQCQPGWQPPLCQRCADGWFGSECTECGHCANNSVCDKKTGVCPFCDGDFVAPLCVDEKMPHYGDKETVSLAGPVAGAAVGCSIVFLITGILIGLFLRRSRSKQTTEHLSSANETSSTAERPGSTSVKDTSDYSNNVYDALDPRDENIAPYSSLYIQTSSKGT
ncbi:multiple epidermal growth factor-like domains protein 11 [Pomacea canaliculata]|uniref:multiple epidermal growth factor-like domains protein 11 n=1 Tax=Pomacea canaliculata TaxID=400727 RepID=UPI000D72CD89|nr:multiple epidermal growth factor-like domains protein 11 [Pomacea canaliculata]